MTEDIILENDAFEVEETPVPVKIPKIDRPDLVEIGDNFDATEINPILVDIVKTNELFNTWEELQRLLDSLLNQQFTIMEDKFQDEPTRKIVDTLSTKISHSINEHSNCPFTIQRLCELVIEPKKYYKMYIKYLRAVEKVLSVTSYWEDYVNKNSSTSQTGEETTLLPSFTVQLEPHNFESNDNEFKASEIEDTSTTKEASIEDNEIMEEVTKSEEAEEVVMAEADDVPRKKENIKPVEAEAAKETDDTATTTAKMELD